MIRTTRKKKHGVPYWEVCAKGYVVGAIITDPTSGGIPDSIAVPVNSTTNQRPNPPKCFGVAAEALEFFARDWIPADQLDDLVDEWDEEATCLEWDGRSWQAPRKAVA